jgi:hypothetical protein
MSQTFSYSVTTHLPRERVWQVLIDAHGWQRFSDIYGNLKWAGEPWVPGSCLLGTLTYPIPIKFRYLLKVCTPCTIIRYLADSPELGFANERTIRLNDLRGETLIQVDAYTVGTPVCKIPGGNLGFLKMLTERFFSHLAAFCDGQAVSPAQSAEINGKATASGA